jgi:hypothetical protein
MTRLRTLGLALALLLPTLYPPAASAEWFGAQWLRARRAAPAASQTAPAASQAAPAAVRAELQRFAEQTRMSCAVHNGKLFIKVDTAALQRGWDAYCRIGGGKVLEFNGRGHLFTRFNGTKCADFLETLDLSTFSAPTQPRVTTLVKLTDAEHRELNAYVDAAQRDSAGTVGTFCYGGGRPRRYYPGSTTANCTSWISSAKLDGCQSLARTCGVWDAASPSAWIQSLARNGNERVEAVLLHKFTGDVGSWQQVDRFITESMAKPH